MREDQHQFLELPGRLPARLTAEQAAWILNCQPHDIPTLMADRLLKPLGNPGPWGMEYFAAAELVEQMEDGGWLAKLTVDKCTEPAPAKEKCTQRSVLTG